MATFYHLLGAYTLIKMFPVLTSWLSPSLSEIIPILAGWGGVVIGPLALFCMSQCYRIKARPFWDHWHVYGAFFSSALILGSLVVGLLFGIAEQIAGGAAGPLLWQLSIPLLFGLIVQGISLVAHFRYLERRGDEAAVSRTLLCVTFGKLYIARYVSWGILTLLTLFFLISIPSGGWALLAWGTMILLALAHEVIGRALFYVVVVPTSHPGSFFFGNNVFVTHAQKTGLASMPQTGVLPERH
jgi:DMSO reductase anchor subunit